MGAVVGTEGRKPSAETGPRIPRPGAAVRSNSASRKTMSGVAPAANPPPILAGAPLPFPSHDDDMHADTHAEARVERPADAVSGHDDAATAHGLPPDMAQALADLARDRSPPSHPPASEPAASKPPVSLPPATKRMASNAPIAPRAPSIAPPIAPPPRSGPSVAPSAPSGSLASQSSASSPKPRSPTLPPPLPASHAAPQALPLPPSMASTGPMGSPITALPMPPSYVPDPKAPSYALVQPSQPPPPPQASHASAPWGAPPAMQPSQPPMYAPMPAPPFAGPNAHGSAVDDESAPLTYQVYAPESVPPPRPMNLSRMSMPDFAPKPNIKARIGLGIVAACVFVGTAILIIAGASDDPPRSKATAGAAATSAATSAAAATPLVAPVIIAPPVVDPASATSAAVADPPAPPVAVAKAKGKAKGAGSAGARGAALPPNPFAAGAPAKPAKKK